MEFTCAHCGQTIQCNGVVVDKRHFVHARCETEFIEALNSVNELLETENDLTEAE